MCLHAVSMVSGTGRGFLENFQASELKKERAWTEKQEAKTDTTKRGFLFFGCLSVTVACNMYPRDVSALTVVLPH